MFKIDSIYHDILTLISTASSKWLFFVDNIFNQNKLRTDCSLSRIGRNRVAVVFLGRFVWTILMDSRGAIAPLRWVVSIATASTLVVIVCLQAAVATATAAAAMAVKASVAGTNR